MEELSKEFKSLGLRFNLIENGCCFKEGIDTVNSVKINEYSGEKAGGLSDF